MPKHVFMGGIRELFSRVHCLHLRHVTHASDRDLTDVVIHYGAMCLGVIVVYGIYNHAMRLLKGVFQGQLRDLSRSRAAPPRRARGGVFGSAGPKPLWAQAHRSGGKSPRRAIGSYGNTFCSWSRRGGFDPRDT